MTNKEFKTKEDWFAYQKPLLEEMREGEKRWQDFHAEKIKPLLDVHHDGIMAVYDKYYKKVTKEFYKLSIELRREINNSLKEKTIEKDK